MWHRVFKYVKSIGAQAYTKPRGVHRAGRFRLKMTWQNPIIAFFGQEGFRISKRSVSNSNSLTELKRHHDIPSPTVFSSVSSGLGRVLDFCTPLAKPYPTQFCVCPTDLSTLFSTPELNFLFLLAKRIKL